MPVTRQTPDPSFPRRRVADLLRNWYEQEMNSALNHPRAPADARRNGGTVFDIQPEMSSTKAVRVLLDLTDILGFELSKDVIKKGGYRRKDEFVLDLLSQIEKAFATHCASMPSHVPSEKENNAHAQA